MNVPTTIPVYFGGATAVALEPGLLTQNDYGQKLLFADLDLPDAYEVFFSNIMAGGTAKPQIGDSTGVTIPDEYINGGNVIYAWLFLHAGEDDGRTMRTVSIPVTAASTHVETPPTPAQQGVIDQAIAALNAGVNAAEAAQAAAEAAQDAIEDMSVSASTLAAGADATVSKSVDPETGAVSLAFGIPQGQQGQPGQDGQDGSPGADGRDGTNGQDGTSAYVWIRYAAAQPTADADMKTTPDAWMGIYSGDSSTAPEHYTDYTWYNIKGQTGPVSDVQVNGTSVVTGGVANVPKADSSVLGAVRVDQENGIAISANGTIYVLKASVNRCKYGTNDYTPIVPNNQHLATFYGLAKAAGDATQSASSNSNPVGSYTESAKSAISEMLGGSVAVSGSTPTITALPGIRYVCGEVATLDITLPASGIVDVTFESGSTATVLTITPPTGVTAVKWANGFDPTALEANTTYEINIADGLGVAGAWAAT